MSIYAYFKGLIPQPTDTPPRTPTLLEFGPRYGNRIANRHARGALHPAACAEARPPLPARCCTC
ncbi:hypothetical protein [Pseudomarimonas arenosa]|uniref:Uncharacterized protein n=1 Tax=Pseudomarimonas arenosa TaxID=2774145 RepID=A0AAW3ZJV8_9GAMM|nr:hypothetical protein [Pseudomarimonas arenosa]MBD8525740.1 hypothetical protein [Pseudomarimonas arenosa]